MPSNAEAGIRRTDIYFVRETLDADGNPITPTDPNFHLYSSVVETSETEPSAEWDERTGVGNYLPVAKNRTQETHELTVEYDLERALVDSNGNPDDAFTDAAGRGLDHRIENTHSYLAIEEKAAVMPESTWHHHYFDEKGNSHPSGSSVEPTEKPTRLEHYGRGCVPEEASLELAPEDSGVVTSEMQYQAHKFRRYQIDQPASSTTLAVKSTASGDTGDVELETKDGSQTATMTLDGTTLQTTSSDFGSVRVYLPQQIEGDLEVYTYDSGNSSAEQLLTVIRGKNSRDGIEGDQGVPMVGAGSFGSDSELKDEGVPAIGTDVDWAGFAAGETISSATLSVENEIAENPTTSGLVKDLRVGSQTLSFEAAVFGETESPQKFDEMLLGNEAEVLFSLMYTDISIPRAYVNDGGSIERESGNAVLQVDVTWNALMPEDGSDPIQFTNTASA